MRRLAPILVLASVALAGYWIATNAPRRSAPVAASGAAPPIDDAGGPSVPDAHALPPREIAPTTPPGEPVLIELTEGAAARYADARPTEADEVYAAVVEELGRPEVVYDPGLGRAARELAYQHSVIGGLVPQDIVDFLLRAAGAVDRSVVQGYTATGGDDLTAVRKRLNGLLGPKRDAILRVGVGEAWIVGAKRPRYIAILISRRQIDVGPAPRRVELGAQWVLNGTLPAGYEEPSALVLRPEGHMEPVEVNTSGRRFSVIVDAGRTSGTIQVSVSATGPHGPGPLLQLPVVVGVDLPEVFESYTAPDESGLSSPVEAEKKAFALLNADRARYGIAALRRDSRLDEVARAHSLDMRDNGFFGHYSVETGTPSDRLAAAAYKVALHGENVASGPSIAGAEAGLMRSLGHRRNILQGRFTHVGIGVRGQRDGARIQWYLTQMFATPVGDIDPTAASRRLYERMAEWRRDEGAGTLERIGRLDRIAESVVGAVAEGQTDGVASKALESAKRAGLTRNGAFAWVGSTVDLDALELPAQAVDEGYPRVGVAVDQLPDHPNGLIGVVILFAGD